MPSIMHQSSFRILRWTEDNRPYTKDFQDLFCTMIVALPLTVHRVNLRKKHHTFTTSEAVNSLGNLRFTQSNRTISPEDPNKFVTTKIATTFSMIPSMAKDLCNKFLRARLIESADDKKATFNSTNAVWQLTPKGISVLQSFAHRNGIAEKHIFDVLDSHRNTMNLLVLEREPETDQLVADKATAKVIFRRFAGIEGPNVQNGQTPSSDSDSVSEGPNGLIGVKMSQERRIGNKVYHKTFTGKAAIDWLMNCCTLADEREAHDIAKLFLDNQFIELLNEDKEWRRIPDARFPCTKTCVFRITEDGQRAAKWIRSKDDVSADAESPIPSNPQRDSNNSRMTIIISTPSLRFLFREFLRETHCEENFLFYLEVKEFVGRWAPKLRDYESGVQPPLETMREVLAAAYDLYNAYLAPGSPCELNIDHNLRNALVSRMTKFELPDKDLFACVKDIISLYDQAKNSVFKLMASDSVPKFLRDPKYAQALQEHNDECYQSNVKAQLPIRSSPTRALVASG